MRAKQRLQKLDACPDAVAWVGNKSHERAWNECQRADWMLWIAARLCVDRKLLVLATCDCAETALQYIPEGEDRPALCIQTVRNWCNGTASIEEVRAALRGAAYASYASVNAAYAAAAAAYAAADAAAYAAADAAAEAASYAADAASYAADAARKAAQQTSADLVRKRIPFSTIKALL